MTICPFAVWRPVGSHSGPMSAHLGLVLHVQVGDGSCYGWFAVPAHQASSTWWVSKTGVLEQYVDSDLMAWAEAQGNGTWDSVETEGGPGEALTPAQVHTLSRLYQWGATVYGWPYALSESPAVPGFGWHGMGGAAWGGHPGCPGDLRKSQRAAIVAGARVLSPPAPEIPTMRTALPAAALPAHIATATWNPAGTRWDVTLDGADGHCYHIWWTVPAGPTPGEWHGSEDLTAAG